MFGVTMPQRPLCGLSGVADDDLNSVDDVLHISPTRKKFSGVKSGDLGGQAIDPLLSPSLCPSDS
jgi:hypothetical protein